MEPYMIFLWLIILGMLVIVALKTSKNHDANTSTSFESDELISISEQQVDPMHRTEIINETAQFTYWKENQKNQILSRSSVFQLIIDKGVDQIQYVDLLNTREWQLKRLEILIRDKYTCQDCNRKYEKLDVHHNYYLAERLPWDIDNYALVSLCKPHHKSRHFNKSIPLYKKVNGNLVPTNNNGLYCPRCDGMGYISQYSHVQNGICFRCHGDCFDRTIFSNQLRWVTNSDITYQIDNLLNSVSQEYFDIHLKIEGDRNSPPPVNPNENEPPFDDLPF